MIRYKFSKEINEQFSKTVRKRVNTFFEDNGSTQNANSLMLTKTAFALLLYFVPYLLIILGGFSNIPLLFTLWILMGTGTAFVGTSVMHDALHGSFSKSKSINSLVGFSAFVIGVDPLNWKLQHNVLHHSYTNIEHTDEDISPRYVMRFSPNQTKRWFHKYQHIYVVLFYLTTTLVWVFAKDFTKLFHYRKIGMIPSGKAFLKPLALVIFRKTVYYFFILFLPIYLLPISTGMVILMFLVMHLVAGLSLSLIFQPAHVMPNSDFLIPENDKIKENFDVHQLLTTTNFGMNNKILTWFAGGLNFQIEHHLFPNICHIHYPRIAKIVQQTTEEFNLPYYTESTFRSAIFSHFRMLWALGRFEDGKSVRIAAGSIQG